MHSQDLRRSSQLLHQFNFKSRKLIVVLRGIYHDLVNSLYYKADEMQRYLLDAVDYPTRIEG